MPKAFCGIEIVRWNVLLNLCGLWEKKLPSNLHESYLIERMRSISHRKAQMNRTHRVQKDDGPSPFPSPEGKGSNHRGGGWGGGPLSCGLETVRLKPPWPPCALWEKKVTSVKEKPPHAPRKQPNRGNLTYYALIWNKSAGWWKVLTTHQANHPHNTQVSSPTIKDITHKKSACYVLHSSICPSCS